MGQGELYRNRIVIKGVTCNDHTKLTLQTSSPVVGLKTFLLSELKSTQLLDFETALQLSRPSASTVQPS